MSIAARIKYGDLMITGQAVERMRTRSRRATTCNMTQNGMNGRASTQTFSVVIDKTTKEVGTHDAPPFAVPLLVARQ